MGESKSEFAGVLIEDPFIKGDEPEEFLCLALMVTPSGFASGLCPLLAELSSAGEGVRLWLRL